MRAAVVLSAAFCVLALHAARAEDAPSSADEGAIHDVITKQLDAFNRDDGPTAESFAAPGIKDKFPSPDMFMGMVKSAYGALIHPKSTRFEALTQTGLGLVQKMTLIDSNGVAWTVAYTMTQVDGQWRISGCFVLKSDAVNA